MGPVGGEHGRRCRHLLIDVQVKNTSVDRSSSVRLDSGKHIHVRNSYLGQSSRISSLNHPVTPDRTLTVIAFSKTLGLG